MKAIYLAGGKKSNIAIKVMTQHLKALEHRVTRTADDPLGWDVTLRWGISYEGNKPSLNGRVNQFDKMEALIKFERCGIKGPKVFTDWRLLRDEDFPVLSRKVHHTKGKDIIVCKTKRAASLHPQDFFTPWIPTETEYRVWVINGRVISISEKQFKGEGEYKGYMRNQRFGFKFGKRDDLRRVEEIETPCIQAVEALDLDWGAVDILLGKDGNYYVLEVNSMPAIENEKRSSGIRLAAHVSKWAERQ
jgi:glutathione synthase/RimK-type ligase-like ATP-grasp enzyme